jgi:hypothetical protein
MIEEIEHKAIYKLETKADDYPFMIRDRLHRSMERGRRTRVKIDLLNKLADDVFEKIIWATARRLVQEDVIKNSPPCRAKHLALHGRKLRTRRKNRRRILKEWARNGWKKNA